MTSRARRLALVAGAALVLASVSSAIAQGQAPGRQGRQRNARVLVAQIPVELLQTVCKLTPEQVTKIKAIQTKLAEDLRALRPQQGAAPDPAAAQKRRDLTQQATTEINNILTPEQKEALRNAAPEIAVLRSLGIPLQVVGDLKLTDEQKKKLTDIAREIREKVQNLSPEERRSKMRELTADARTKAEALLTAEQKEVIKKFNEENRQRRGRAGNRRGGANPPA